MIVEMMEVHKLIRYLSCEIMYMTNIKDNMCSQIIEMMTKWDNDQDIDYHYKNVDDMIMNILKTNMAEEHKLLRYWCYVNEYTKNKDGRVLPIIDMLMIWDNNYHYGNDENYIYNWVIDVIDIMIMNISKIEMIEKCLLLWWL